MSVGNNFFLRRNNTLPSAPLQTASEDDASSIEARQQETRILVVDDSDLMRHSLRTLLERQDHWKV
jgi:PleD family two-component response regulator